jgi:hypothetical protein
MQVKIFHTDVLVALSTRKAVELSSLGEVGFSMHEKLTHSEMSFSTLLRVGESAHCPSDEIAIAFFLRADAVVKEWFLIVRENKAAAAVLGSTARMQVLLGALYRVEEPLDL